MKERASFRSGARGAISSGAISTPGTKEAPMVNCSWVGIDLHRSRSQVAVLDDHGSELISRRIVNDPQTFLELLAEIDGESKIALEATYGWEWLADLLQDAGYELHLAHPLRTKA